MDISAFENAVKSKDLQTVQDDMYKNTCAGYQVFNPFVNPVEASATSLVAKKAIDLGYDRSVFNDKIVYDLGCSMGFFSFHAACLGAIRVIGIDKDDMYVRKLNVLAENYGNLFSEHKGKISFVCQDLLSLPRLQVVDVAMIHSLIHWFFVFDKNLTMDRVMKWMADSVNDCVLFEGCIDASEEVMVNHKVDLERFNRDLFFETAKKYFRFEEVKTMSYNPKRIAVRLYK